MSVSIADIRVIRIVKESKALLGGGIGCVFGTLIGAGVGNHLSEEWMWDKGTISCAIVGGLAFGIIGVIVAGAGKTFQIERMSDSEIQEALDKLRKKARIRDYK